MGDSEDSLLTQFRCLKNICGEYLLTSLNLQGWWGQQGSPENGRHAGGQGCPTGHLDIQYLSENKSGRQLGLWKAVTE
jgi:hypothetical protein